MNKRIQNKLLLILLMVALCTLTFAIAVNAQGIASDEFGTAETLEGIPVDLTDTASRVVLKGADGLYRTFPSAYIYFKTGSGNWNWRGEAKCDFSYINNALGLTEENAYTIDSVIRIEVPDDLKYIEGYSGKVNLKEMYFSPNAEMTDLRPMGNGCGVEKITMPPKQTSYASYMFHTCPNLKTVIFYENENLKSLPTEMFKACTSLEEFVVPDSVTSLGGSFFSGCSSLKRVILSPGITSIGTIFSYLASLEYVNTENITSYSAKAFQGCSSLDGIVLNEAVTSIPIDFCHGCKSLTSITIPSNVTIINGYAFNGCTKLTTVINKSDKLTAIYGNAFASCPITEFYFPDGIKELGASSFIGAQFTSIDLPNTITTLGTAVFQNCSKLTYIRLPESLTEVPHDFIKGTIGSKITIVVPMGCTGIYSQFSLQNSGINVIIYTGSAKDAFVASVQSKASGWVSKIVYENHCDHYYNSVHVNDTNPCVINCDRCKAYGVAKENPVHTEEIRVTYVSFAKAGEKVVGCGNEGCSYGTSYVLDPLFICQGYSASEAGNGISLGFKVNNEAAYEYKTLTGNAIKYGVFAVSQSRLGENVIFDESGNVTEGVICAEIKATEFTAFDIKVVGFSDENKSSLLALGAYVATTKDGVTTYSYMQESEPNEGQKYHFVSYNEIIG